jgi:NifB/MoaA-like Fe-S oxidoreductase
VFLADELYLRAGLHVPGEAHYGDYPQIEDGVGMVRRFMTDVRRALRRPDLAAEIGITTPGSLDGTVATGELFYPILSDAIDRLNERLGTRLRTVAVRNRFFGEEVTVAGLIAGGDVLATRDSFKGSFLIVPEQACLKSGDTFLDDLKITDLEQRLGLPVSHGGPSVFTLLDKVRELASR